MGKAGRLDTSMKVYMKMQGFGLRPSAGKLETALKLWDEMRKFEEHSISEGINIHGQLRTHKHNFLMALATCQCLKPFEFGDIL